MPAAALAFALDGKITGGAAGAYQKLDPTIGFAVGNDTFQDTNLYVFDEDQNILLERDIAVDLAPGARVIPAGTIVASHYVFFDPGFAAQQVGYVEFDSAILSVATRQDTLAATDFLANTDVKYLNPALRGLEWQDVVWIDPENPFRVRVNWTASTPGDYIRVFTARSPGM
ncbi:MAG: hypothetical protein AAGE76_04670 [Pseudomonadota bacterium]